MEKTCKHCGRIFEKTASCSLKDWGKRLFCSRNCKYNTGRSIIVCAICGVERIIKKALEHHLKTCSKKCASKYRSAMTIAALANGCCIIPLRDRPELRKNQSQKMKKAYEEGRMSYMKNVWTSHTSKIGTIKKQKEYLWEKVDEKTPWRRGWKLQHRVVMERYLDRKLESTEVVHHKNGNKQDNRIENLELMTFSEHMCHHRRSGTL